jgi:AcrR family transcriptional regulator
VAARRRAGVQAAPPPRAASRQPARRGEEREARVDWILDAALELVVSAGVSGLTTPALARKVGYTPAAFYRYFASKAALLAALEVRTAERTYGRFFDALAAARPALEQRLAGASPRLRALAEIALLGRAYAAIARADPQQFQLVGALLTGDRSWIDDDVSARLRELVLPRMATIIGHFANAEEVGALAPGIAPKRAMATWLALHAVLAAAPLAAAQPELLDVDELRVELLRTLLRGWGGAERDVEAAIAAVE